MTTDGPREPLAVLLVEGSPGDPRLAKEAFREANPAINMRMATDGVELWRL
jgi:hypothetical protein